MRHSYALGLGISTCLNYHGTRKAKWQAGRKGGRKAERQVWNYESQGGRQADRQALRARDLQAFKALAMFIVVDAIIVVHNPLVEVSLFYMYHMITACPS